MTDEMTENPSGRVQNRRVHMANERTFLAWIRTSIAIMAFGFVVEKFALFVRQMSQYLSLYAIKDSTHPSTVPAGPGYSSVIGVILIGLGAMMGLLAFVRYKKIEKQIDGDTYRPSLLLDILLTISIVSVGFFLIVYLSHIF